MKKKNYRKILVIRFSSIGDIVLCSPIFRTLKKQLNAEVHWLTKSSNAFINEHNPYIDKILQYNSSVRNLLPELRAQKYDLIVDLHKNIRSMIFITALRLPFIQFDKANVKKWILARFHRNLISEPGHLVDRYFNSLKKIGIKNDYKGLDYFYGDPVHNPISKKPYIAYGIGGTYYTKKMPPDQIIRHFSHLPHPLVLLGGSTEVAEANVIQAALGDWCINLVHQCDLHTTAKIIEEAEWVISHDTATMHIAAAFRKKILSIWGATSPQFGMYPYLPGDFQNRSFILERPNLSCHPCSKLGGDHCPKGHFKCMLDLDPDYVQKKVRQISDQ